MPRARSSPIDRDEGAHEAQSDTSTALPTTAETARPALLGREIDRCDQQSDRAYPACSQPWCRFLLRHASEQMTSPLKAVVGWYEGPNSRCRHKIFGDIFFPASGISTVCLLEDFLADDAKQAFVIWIEDPGTGVSGCGHISDQGRKLISPREWQYLRRDDVRLCGMPGIHNDDWISWPRWRFTQLHLR